MTNKEIKELIKIKRKEQEALYDILRERQYNVELEWKKEFKHQVDNLNTDINYYENMLNSKETKQDKIDNEITPEIKEFLDKYDVSVDFGTKLKVSYISEDKRFLILTKKGHNGWYAIGETKYYPAEHWIVDITKGNWINDRNEFNRIEGKLTKEVKEQMIKYINDNLKGK